jgi:hypothetical protein
VCGGAQGCQLIHNRLAVALLVEHALHSARLTLDGFEAAREHGAIGVV